MAPNKANAARWRPIGQAVVALLLLCAGHASAKDRLPSLPDKAQLLAYGRTGDSKSSECRMMEAALKHMNDPDGVDRDIHYRLITLYSSSCLERLRKHGASPSAQYPARWALAASCTTLRAMGTIDLALCDEQ
ncbi:MAG: hypothetical protein JO036_15740 [Candidatus Eremiobacteraeota bacterium]|nr:hypothetical protein [Candidatus Eremiobacteraeota bacterium]